MPDADITADRPRSASKQPSPPSPADRAAWASVPWTPVTSARGALVGWHKSRVPYRPPGEAVSLQTLDVWVPGRHAHADPAPPDASRLPGHHQHQPAVWIVYIHGGAWRDPLIDASSFAPTATKILLHHHHHHHHHQARSSSSSSIAGLASLNYRLSPHPRHPPPAAGSDDDDDDARARSARHPDHIADVLAGLSFLRRIVCCHNHNHSRCRHRWILAGHSCGATLAFQSVMDPSRWFAAGGDLSSSPSSSAVAADVDADAVVGFSGLYDLAGFIAAPPAGWEALREPYAEFMAGAFGADERVWRAVCPATADGPWPAEWIGRGSWGGGGGGGGKEDDGNSRGDGDGDGQWKKKLVVLVQSRQDTLVPYAQLEALRAVLAPWKEEGIEVREAEAEGDHDELWQDGTRMAEVLCEVAEKLGAVDGSTGGD